MSIEQIAHPHVAKTGGTSRNRFFVDLFGESNVLLYNPPSDRLRRFSDLRSEKHPYLFRIKESLKETPFAPIINHFVYRLSTVKGGSDLTWEDLPNTNYNVVTGHFPASRLDSLPGHFTTAVFRDPLKRMYSHYDHHCREYGKTRFRVDTDYCRGITFQAFAMQKHLRNYQTQALAGKSLRNFDLVGTTDNLDLWGERLLNRLGIDPGKYYIGHHNLARNKQPLEVTREFKREFEEFHAEDYKNYRLALELQHMQ